jgi:hypothetical protein
LVKKVEGLKRYMNYTCKDNDKGKINVIFSYPYRWVEEENEVVRVERFISRGTQDNVMNPWTLDPSKQQCYATYVFNLVNQ